MGPAATVNGWPSAHTECKAGESVVVILTGFATLYLGAINVLIPMIAHAMASNPSTRQDAYTLVDLELGAGNTNTLFVLVPLMVWMWRAAKNTEAFPTPDGGLKPTWAIWGWIVPVLNVSYPLRMMLQLVKEEREGDGWANLARLWWLAFVSSIAITLGEAFGLLGGSRPGNLSGTAQEHLAFFGARSITGRHHRSPHSHRRGDPQRARARHQQGTNRTHQGPHRPRWRHDDHTFPGHARAATGGGRRLTSQAESRMTSSVGRIDATAGLLRRRSGRAAAGPSPR